ncbi:hypothetical protein [Paracoccus sphaerophysae]|uniref:Uncharacterized protein n=1 Tax=Paracoccus sphaerophysae TaxID=690417 RepID=A0A099ETS9_9RHOB|nr:hypothetical protein [Paracoccus sphaerophysae]KGJ01674.1 hypothetical protein IC63_16420 [Paracoccus sphaerophysae]
MILGLTFVAMLAGAIGVLVSTPERQGRIILAQIGAGVAIIVLGGKLLPDASKGEDGNTVAFESAFAFLVLIVGVVVTGIIAWLTQIGPPRN